MERVIMTPSEWYKQTENEYINKRYIMFGLGGGEYVSEVLNNCKTEVKIIVYEPAASGVGQSDADYAGLKGLSSAGVEIYVEGREQDSFQNFIYQFVDYSSLQGMIVFKHPDYKRSEEQNDGISVQLKQSEQLFDQSIASADGGIRASRFVRERFGAESFENLAVNFRKLGSSKSFGSLIDKIDKDVPAIIVASGPSLAKNMHLLKEAKGKSVIISADSAVSALLANDIVPDLYISVDPNKEAKSFEDDRVKDIPSVVELTSSVNAIKEGQEHFFLFNRDNKYLENFLDEYNVDMHMIGSGGSVANMCFDIAVTIGFRTMIFIGLDLAYTGNKTHVENTARYGMAIEESTVEYTTDIYGNQVKSSGEFAIYRGLIEEGIAANPDMCVIDATEGGALVRGTKIMTFAEAISKYCNKDFSIANAIAEAEDLFTDEQKIALDKYIDDIPVKIRELSSDLRKSLSNYDEMYLMAKRRNLNKGRLSKILSDNDRLSNRINSSSILPYIEYLSQDAIHEVQENAYKHNNDVYEEILEAAAIGKTYAEGMLNGTKKALEILEG